MSYADFIVNPEFASFATSDLTRQSLIDQFLADSEIENPIDRWATLSNFRARAIGYATAHKLVLHDRLTGSDGVASPGIPSSISVSKGSESVSFKLPTIEDATGAGYYLTTQWGIQYLEMIRKGRFRQIGRVV
ncbi:MAG: DUF4054 domain-containing protein [Planktothrix sp.]